MESVAWRTSAACYSSLTLKNLALFSLSLIVLQSIYQVVYYRFFHPLARFPGPFWGSITRLWTAYHSLMKREHMACGEQCRKHGTLSTSTQGSLQGVRCEESSIATYITSRAYCSHHTNNAGGQPQLSFTCHLQSTCRQGQDVHHRCFWQRAE